jgi:uncharacterized membrane protein YheB (UPF0754 family)
MTDITQIVFRYVMPPLLGAVIGYITNALAIKMLFRPLTEKRFFGLRIPLTPGIIPRRREELAESIGRMVSDSLLTEETLRKQIEAPEFRLGIRNSVAGITDSLLHSVPRESDLKSINTLIAGMESLAVSLIRNFIDSDNFQNMIKALSVKIVDGISTLRLNEIFPNSDAAVHRALEAVSKIPGSRIEDLVKSTICRWIREKVDANAALSSFLAPDSFTAFKEFLDSIYIPVLDHFVVWLNKEEVRAELTTVGKKFLRDILKKLNIFQRFLISAGQYDRVLEERMPEIIGDLISTIDESGREEKNKEQVLTFLITLIEKGGQAGLGDLSEELSLDIPEKCATFVHYVFSLLDRDSVRGELRVSLERVLEKYGDEKLGDLLYRFSGLEEEKIAAAAAELLGRWAAHPEAPERIAAEITKMLHNFLARLSDRPLNALISMDTDQKVSFDALLTEKLISVVGERLPELIRTFNVKKLVVEKINALEMENVEALLLMVIAKHLKWINLFGALLGSLIGGIQVIVNSVRI